jgi:four helix bundle protein
MPIQQVTDLRVYRESFRWANRIFHVSRKWPPEEKYALTGQIRRSSRAVCANLSEAWRKRRYRAHFVSKLSDADAEAAETRTWLRFAKSCGYMDRETFDEFDRSYDQICGGLVRMMTEPEKWCGPSNIVQELMPPYDPS